MPKKPTQRHLIGISIMAMFLAGWLLWLPASTPVIPGLEAPPTRQSTQPPVRNPTYGSPSHMNAPPQEAAVEGDDIGAFPPRFASVNHDPVFGVQVLDVVPQFSSSPDSFRAFSRTTLSIVGVNGAPVGELSQEDAWAGLTTEVVNLQVAGFVGGPDIDGLPNRVVSGTVEVTQSLHEAERLQDPSIVETRYPGDLYSTSLQFFEKTKVSDGLPFEIDHPPIDDFAWRDLAPLSHAIGSDELFAALEAGEPLPDISNPDALEGQNLDELTATYEEWLERRRGFMENGNNWDYDLGEDPDRWQPPEPPEDGD